MEIEGSAAVAVEQAKATLVTVVVRGEPQPRGSKKPFVIYKDRKKKIPARREDGSIMFNVTDDNPESKKWMETVAWAARSAWRQAPLEEVALDVVCAFFVKRPEGHYGTGKNRRLLKDSASARPRVNPDLDKYTRGTLDALTGIVWKDDGMIVGLTLDLWYAVPRDAEDDGQGVVIKVGLAPQQQASDLPLESRTRWVPPGDDDPPAQDSLLA